MSDVANTITVVLEGPTRTDDLEPLLEAIKQLRGVVDARINVRDPEDYARRVQERVRLHERLWEVLKDRS